MEDAGRLSVHHERLNQSPDQNRGHPDRQARLSHRSRDYAVLQEINSHNDLAGGEGAAQEQVPLPAYSDGLSAVHSDNDSVQANQASSSTDARSDHVMVSDSPPPSELLPAYTGKQGKLSWMHKAFSRVLNNDRVSLSERIVFLSSQEKRIRQIETEVSVSASVHLDNLNKHILLLEQYESFAKAYADYKSEYSRTSEPGNLSVQEWQSLMRIEQTVRGKEDAEVSFNGMLHNVVRFLVDNVESIQQQEQRLNTHFPGGAFEKLCARKDLVTDYQLLNQAVARVNDLHAFDYFTGNEAAISLFGTVQAKRAEMTSVSALFLKEAEHLKRQIVAEHTIGPVSKSLDKMMYEFKDMTRRGPSTISFSALADRIAQINECVGSFQPPLDAIAWLDQHCGGDSKLDDELVTIRIHHERMNALYKDATKELHAVVLRTVGESHRATLQVLSKLQSFAEQVETVHEQLTSDTALTIPTHTGSLFYDLKHECERLQNNLSFFLADRFDVYLSHDPYKELYQLTKSRLASSYSKITEQTSDHINAVSAKASALRELFETEAKDPVVIDYVDQVGSIVQKYDQARWVYASWWVDQIYADYQDWQKIGRDCQRMHQHGDIDKWLSSHLSKPGSLAQLAYKIDYAGDELESMMVASFSNMYQDLLNKEAALNNDALAKDRRSSVNSSLYSRAQVTNSYRSLLTAVQGCDGVFDTHFVDQVKDGFAGSVRWFDEHCDDLLAPFDGIESPAEIAAATNLLQEMLAHPVELAENIEEFKSHSSTCAEVLRYLRQLRDICSYIPLECSLPRVADFRALLGDDSAAHFDVIQRKLLSIRAFLNSNAWYV